MRLLLLKQDEISMLEECLDKIDVGEDRELFLGCSRRDGNAARQQTLQELNKSLAEYGTNPNKFMGYIYGKDETNACNQMGCWNRATGHCRCRNRMKETSRASETGFKGAPALPAKKPPT
jgi:hypothetical protein